MQQLVDQMIYLWVQRLKMVDGEYSQKWNIIINKFGVLHSQTKREKRYNFYFF